MDDNQISYIGVENIHESNFTKYDANGNESNDNKIYSNVLSLSPDLLEDIIVNSDNLQIGYDLLREQSIEMKSSVSTKSDSFDLCIQKQLKIFQHIVNIILKKYHNNRIITTTTLSTLNQVKQTTFTSKIYSSTLKMTLKSLEKQSRKMMNLFLLESVMDTYLQIMKPFIDSSSPPPTTTNNTATTTSSPLLPPSSSSSSHHHHHHIHSSSTYLNSLEYQYLHTEYFQSIRLIVMNGMILPSTYYNKNTYELNRNSIQLSLASTYSLFIMSILTGAEDDRLYCIAHLIYLHSIIHDWYQHHSHRLHHIINTYTYTYNTLTLPETVPSLPDMNSSNNNNQYNSDNYHHHTSSSIDNITHVPFIESLSPRNTYTTGSQPLSSPKKPKSEKLILLQKTKNTSEFPPIQSPTHKMSQPGLTNTVVKNSSSNVGNSIVNNTGGNKVLSLDPASKLHTMKSSKSTYHNSGSGVFPSIKTAAVASPAGLGPVDTIVHVASLSAGTVSISSPSSSSSSSSSRYKVKHPYSGPSLYPHTEIHSTISPTFSLEDDMIVNNTMFIVNDDIDVNVDGPLSPTIKEIQTSLPLITNTHKSTHRSNPILATTTTAGRSHFHPHIASPKSLKLDKHIKEPSTKLDMKNSVHPNKHAILNIAKTNSIPLLHTKGGKEINQSKDASNKLKIPPNKSNYEANDISIKENNQAIEQARCQLEQLKKQYNDLISIPHNCVDLIYDAHQHWTKATSNDNINHNSTSPVTASSGDNILAIESTTIPNATTSTTNESHITNTSGKTPNSSSLGYSTYVWSCGQNAYGELGRDDLGARKSFQPIHELNNLNIVSIGAGNEHSAFVTKEGQVYVSGYNDNGQCGLGHTQQVRQVTHMTSWNNTLIERVYISNGCEHSIFLSRDGQAFSCGYNYRGQLGLGTTGSESVPRLIKSLSQKKVIYAASSYHHTFLLCSDHSLYSFGRNDNGQLGHGDLIDKKTPYLVPHAPSNTMTISCGQFHSALSTRDGCSMICGKNDYGQLGFENIDCIKVFTPIVLPDREKSTYTPLSSSSSSSSSSATTTLEMVKKPYVIQICCGYYHTLVLLNNGHVYSTGRNDYGQLGLGYTLSKITGFQLISTLSDKHIISLSSGCYHTIAASSIGIIYVFGRNNHGQLGTGDMNECHSPYPINTFLGKEIVSMATGFYHTLILTKERTTNCNIQSTNHMSSNTQADTNSTGMSKTIYQNISTAARINQYRCPQEYNHLALFEDHKNTTSLLGDLLHVARGVKKIDTHIIKEKDSNVNSTSISSSKRMNNDNNKERDTIAHMKIQSKDSQNDKKVRKLSQGGISTVPTLSLVTMKKFDLGMNKLSSLTIQELIQIMIEYCSHPITTYDSKLYFLNTTNCMKDKYDKESSTPVSDASNLVATSQQETNLTLFYRQLSHFVTLCRICFCSMTINSKKYASAKKEDDDDGKEEFQLHSNEYMMLLHVIMNVTGHLLNKFQPLLIQNLDVFNKSTNESEGLLQATISEKDISKKEDNPQTLFHKYLKPKRIQSNDTILMYSMQAISQMQNTFTLPSTSSFVSAAESKKTMSAAELKETVSAAELKETVLAESKETVSAETKETGNDSSNISLIVSCFHMISSFKEIILDIYMSNSCSERIQEFHESIHGQAQGQKEIRSFPRIHSASSMLLEEITYIIIKHRNVFFPTDKDKLHFLYVLASCCTRSVEKDGRIHTIDNQDDEDDRNDISQEMGMKQSPSTDTFMPNLEVEENDNLQNKKSDRISTDHVSSHIDNTCTCNYWPFDRSFRLFMLWINDYTNLDEVIILSQRSVKYTCELCQYVLTVYLYITLSVCTEDLKSLIFGNYSRHNLYHQQLKLEQISINFMKVIMSILVDSSSSSSSSSSASSTCNLLTLSMSLYHTIFNTTTVYLSNLCSHLYALPTLSERVDLLLCINSSHFTAFLPTIFILLKQVISSSTSILYTAQSHQELLRCWLNVIRHQLYILLNLLESVEYVHVLDPIDKNRTQQIYSYDDIIPSTWKKMCNDQNEHIKDFISLTTDVDPITGGSNTTKSYQFKSHTNIDMNVWWWKLLLYTTDILTHFSTIGITYSISDTYIDTWIDSISPEISLLSSTILSNGIMSQKDISSSSSILTDTFYSTQCHNDTKNTYVQPHTYSSIDKLLIYHPIWEFVNPTFDKTIILNDVNTCLYYPNSIQSTKDVGELMTSSPFSDISSLLHNTSNHTMLMKDILNITRIQYLQINPSYQLLYKSWTKQPSILQSMETIEYLVFATICTLDPMFIQLYLIPLWNTYNTNGHTTTTNTTTTTTSTSNTTNNHNPDSVKNNSSSISKNNVLISHMKYIHQFITFLLSQRSQLLSLTPENINSTPLKESSSLGKEPIVTTKVVVDGKIQPEKREYIWDEILQYIVYMCYNIYVTTVNQSVTAISKIEYHLLPSFDSSYISIEKSSISPNISSSSIDTPSHSTTLTISTTINIQWKRKFKHAIYIIISLYRWKKIYALKLRSMNRLLVDYYQTLYLAITHNNTSVSLSQLRMNHTQILHIYNTANNKLRAFSTHIHRYLDLLYTAEYTTIQMSILSKLYTHWYNYYQTTKSDSHFSHICSYESAIYFQQTIKRLILSLYELLTIFNQKYETNMINASTLDVELVSSSIQLLHLINIYGIPKVGGNFRLKYTPAIEILFSYIRKMNPIDICYDLRTFMTLIEDHGHELNVILNTTDSPSIQGNTGIHSGQNTSSNGNINTHKVYCRQITNKKVYKTILGFFHGLSYQLTQWLGQSQDNVNIHDKQGYKCQMLSFYTDHLIKLQHNRVTAMQELLGDQNITSARVSPHSNCSTTTSPSNTTANTANLTSHLHNSSHNLLNTTSASGDSFRQQKETKDYYNMKKRVQDIITTPIRFQSHQEGYIISNDQLINSYKGNDYTITTWIYSDSFGLSTTSTSSSSTTTMKFIAGKINYNDVWPLIFLRSDRKMVIMYGYGNDMESIISVNIIPVNTWTHITIVLETKKIKLYINGQPDVHTVTKGNTRGVLYPLVLGSCPPSLRTRMDLTKEGFEGYLGYFKYYTRALSSIHIRVIYDQGPPELYDTRERWIYKLLANIRLLIQSWKDYDKNDILISETIPSITSNSSLTHPSLLHQKSTIYEPIMIKLANILQYIFIHDTQSRLRINSFKLLNSLILKGLISNMTLFPYVHLSSYSNTMKNNSRTLKTSDSGSNCNTGKSPTSKIMSFNFQHIVFSSDHSRQSQDIINCPFLCLKTDETIGSSISLITSYLWYLIRLLGICQSPHINYAIEESIHGKIDILDYIHQLSEHDLHLSSRSHSNPHIDSNGYHTERQHSHISYLWLKEFIYYIPGFLMLQDQHSGIKSTSSSPTKMTLPLTPDRLEHTTQLRMHYKQELSYHLLIAIRTLCQMNSWKLECDNIISVVLEQACQIVHSPSHASSTDSNKNLQSPNKHNDPESSRDMIDFVTNIMRRTSFSSSTHKSLGAWPIALTIDILGVLQVLGCNTSYICTGSDILTYVYPKPSRILSWNTHQNQVILLHSHSNNTSKICAMNIKDIRVSPIPLIYSYSDMIISSILKLMNQLSGYIEVLTTDLFCHLHTDHVLHRQYLLQVLRPLEVYIYHQLCHYMISNITTNNTMKHNIMTQILNYESLLNQIFSSSTRILPKSRVNNSMEIPNLNTMTGSETISSLWESSSKCILLNTGLVIESEFPSNESEMIIKDYIFTHYGIDISLYRSTIYENYLLKGTMSKLIHMCNSNTSLHNNNNNNTTTTTNTHISQGYLIREPYTETSSNTMNTSFLPLNDWLSTSADSIYTLTSPVTDDDIVNTLKLLHKIRSDIILSSKELLHASLSTAHLDHIQQYSPLTLWVSLSNFPPDVVLTSRGASVPLNCDLWKESPSQVYTIISYENREKISTINKIKLSLGQKTLLTWFQSTNQVTAMSISLLNMIKLCAISGDNGHIEDIYRTEYHYFPLKSMIEETTVNNDLINAAYLWLKCHENHPMEIQICYDYLTILFSFITYIEHPIYKRMCTSLCIYTIQRLYWCILNTNNPYYLTTSTSVSTNIISTCTYMSSDSTHQELLTRYIHMIELSNHSAYWMIRSRLQNQLRHWTFSPNLMNIHTIQMISILIHLELIQKKCLLNILAIRKGVQDKKNLHNGNLSILDTPYSPSQLNRLSMSYNAPIRMDSFNYINNTVTSLEERCLYTMAPTIVAIGQISVEVDLSVCFDYALSNLYMKNSVNTQSYMISSDSNLEKCESSSSSSLLILSHSLSIEIRLGIVSDDSECIYETVYIGTSRRYIQSGLNPSCHYRICTRILSSHNIYDNNSSNSSSSSGIYTYEWSESVDFVTEDSHGFIFDALKSGPDMIISHDGTRVSYTGDDCWCTILGTDAYSIGVTTWKIRILQSSTAYLFLGIARSQVDLSTFLGGCPHGYGFIGEQAIYHHREKVKLYGESFMMDDIITVILDMNHGTLSYTINGKPMGIAFDHLYGEFYPAFACYNMGQEIELLQEDFHTTCIHDHIPYSHSKNSTMEIQTLYELLYHIQMKLPISEYTVTLIMNICNEWVQGTLVRCQLATGKSIFISSSHSLLETLHLSAGSRVRTPHGAATVLGYGYNHIWVQYNKDDLVWYFTVNAVRKWQEKGYFLISNYDRDLTHNMNTIESYVTGDRSNGHLNPTSPPRNDLSSIPLLSPRSPTFTTPTKDTRQSDVSLNSPTPLSPTSTNNNIKSNSLLYDINYLYDVFQPTGWSMEMDTVLVNYMVQLSTIYKCTIWEITYDMIQSEFRSLQQSLSRLVMNTPTLSHKWGISGPKRKAVVARLGLLLLINHYMECYLYTQLTVDTINKGLTNISSTLFDDNQYIQKTVISHSHPINTSTNTNTSSVSVTEKEVMYLASENDGEHTTKTNDNDDYTRNLNIVTPNLNLNTSILTTIHTNINSTHSNIITNNIQNIVTQSSLVLFQSIKLSHFWNIVIQTATRPIRTDDEYDYPEELLQLKINRLQSFRLYELCQLSYSTTDMTETVTDTESNTNNNSSMSPIAKIHTDDILSKTIFYQLWKELRKESPDRLCMVYTHPMDDGQSRIFKIKFEGEGVDDYGGPYREIFQQIADELQLIHPKYSQSTGQFNSTRPSANSASYHITTEVVHSNNNTTHGKLRCFVPLLLPTPNWNNDSCEKEKYTYTFYPGPISSMYQDMYRFLGQFIGLAIRSKVTVSLELSSYIYKCLVQEKLTMSDISSYNVTSAVYIQKLVQLYTKYTEEYTLSYSQKAGDIDVYSVERRQEIHELNEHVKQLYEEILVILEDITWNISYSNGHTIIHPSHHTNHIPHQVDFTDISEYISWYINTSLCECYDAIEAFRNGFYSIIPKSAVILLTGQELYELIAGSKTIDIDRLRQNTEYDEGLSEYDIHIQYLWEILHDFTSIEKATFLRFVWARSSLPPTNVDFPQKFKIQSSIIEDTTVNPDMYLPRAHTCFFSINLPKYSSKQAMKEKILYAIFNCTEMDADYRLTESDATGWDTTITTI